jgi:hypothetical protein
LVGNSNTRIKIADATPAQPRDARARAWLFVFDCYAKKKAAHPGGPGDAERRSNEIRAKTIILK